MNKKYLIDKSLLSVGGSHVTVALMVHIGMLNGQKMEKEIQNILEKF
jgi:hypothetical protein